MRDTLTTLVRLIMVYITPFYILYPSIYYTLLYILSVLYIIIRLYVISEHLT